MSTDGTEAFFKPRQEPGLKPNRSNPLVANTDLKVGDCCFQTAGSVPPQYLGKVIKTTRHDDKGTVEVEFLQEHIDPRKQNRVGKKIWVDEKKMGYKYSRPTQTHQNRFARVGDAQQSKPNHSDSPWLDSISPLSDPDSPLRGSRPKLKGSPDSLYSDTHAQTNKTPFNSALIANRSPIQWPFSTRKKTTPVPETTQSSTKKTSKSIDMKKHHLSRNSKSAYASKRRSLKRTRFEPRRSLKLKSTKKAWPSVSVYAPTVAPASAPA